MRRRNNFENFRAHRPTSIYLTTTIEVTRVDSTPGFSEVRQQSLCHGTEELEQQMQQFEYEDRLHATTGLGPGNTSTCEHSIKQR
jgi:hypothetical protein